MTLKTLKNLWRYDEKKSKNNATRSNSYRRVGKKNRRRKKDIQGLTERRATFFVKTT